MFTTISKTRLGSVTVTVTSCAVAASLGHHLDRSGEILEFVSLNAFASLLALYVGLGRFTAGMRTSIFLLGLSAALAWETTFGEWPNYFPPLFAAASNAVATFACCVMIRTGEGRVTSARWSIRDLMITTAAVAVLVATASQLKVGAALGRLDFVVIWCLQGVGFAIIAIAAALPVRFKRPRFITLTLPSAALASVALGYVADCAIADMRNYASGNLKWHATCALVQAVAIGGCVWALSEQLPNRRLAGDGHRTSLSVDQA